MVAKKAQGGHTFMLEGTAVDILHFLNQVEHLKLKKSVECPSWNFLRGKEVCRGFATQFLAYKIFSSVTAIAQSNDVSQLLARIIQKCRKESF